MTLSEERAIADGLSGSRIVEVLTVKVRRFAIGKECNDEGPILFFDLGQNELLVLWGQWLYDPHVVATDFPHIDELWEHNNWFKRFELVRSSSSGIVFSLKSIGRETIDSVGTVSVGEPLPTQPSMLFQANLDDLLK